MPDIELSNQLEVQLVQSYATDQSVVNAARVSTQGVKVVDSQKESAGLVNFLMKNRHGTPFEHNSMTFFIEAPIFVFREFHRHRIGWSYNEESGRYKELRGKFYVPGNDRDMIQTGKPGSYTYQPGTNEQCRFVAERLVHAYGEAYIEYQDLLKVGIAKEVARMCLPVATYSSMYATCNARSLMAFLSLRQAHEQRYPKAYYDEHTGTEIVWKGEAMFASTPMKEINIVADKMEERFKQLMPITHAAFVKNGYVAP
jgi:thymidylate synthase (FAD)